MGLWDELGAPDQAPAPEQPKPAAPTAPIWKNLESEDPTKQAPPSPIHPEMGLGEMGWHALWNTPGSAVKFAKDVAHPFMHPQEFAENMGNLGSGVAQKLGLKGGHEDEKYADAVWGELVRKYGSVDAIKQSFAEDPIGTLADFSLPLTGGGGLAARAPGILGTTGRVLRTAGRTMDPFVWGEKAAGITGKAAAVTAGLVTGSGMKPFEVATHAGYEGGEAARNFRDVQLGTTEGEQIVRGARGAVDNILAARDANYVRDMANVNQSTTILPWRDIDRAVSDTRKMGAVKGYTFSQDFLKFKQDLENKLGAWKHTLNPADYHTAEGFDAMKKEMNRLAEAYPKGTTERKILDRYAQTFKNIITKEVPEYADAMNTYHEFSDTLRQIHSTLSLPRDERKLNIDTALRKLNSIMRRNVNTNYGQREKLADILQRSGAPYLKEQLAGLSLSSPEAHGLARLIPAIMGAGRGLGTEAAAIAASSPRLMGSAAYRIGQAGKVAVPVYKAARPVYYADKYSQPPRLNIDTTGWGQASGGRIGRAMRAARRH
jgi:hypothetical protein